MSGTSWKRNTIAEIFNIYLISAYVYFILECRFLLNKGQYNFLMRSMVKKVEHQKIKFCVSHSWELGEHTLQVLDDPRHLRDVWNQNPDLRILFKIHEDWRFLSKLRKHLNVPKKILVYAPVVNWLCQFLSLITFISP